MKKKYILVFTIFIGLFFCLSNNVKADTTCSYTMDNYPFIIKEGEIFEDLNPYLTYRSYVYSKIGDAIYGAEKNPRASGKWKRLAKNTNIQIVYSIIGDQYDSNGIPDVKKIKFQFTLDNSGNVSSAKYIASVDSNKKYSSSEFTYNIPNSSILKKNLGKNSCPDVVVLDLYKETAKPSDKYSVIFVDGIYGNRVFETTAKAEALYDERIYVPDSSIRDENVPFKLILYKDEIYKEFLPEEACLINAYYDYPHGEYELTDAGKIVESYLQVDHVKELLNELVTKDIGEGFDIKEFFGYNEIVGSDLNNNKSIRKTLEMMIDLYDNIGKVSNNTIDEDARIIRRRIYGSNQNPYVDEWTLMKCEEPYVTVGNVSNNDIKATFAKKRNEWINKYKKDFYGNEIYLSPLLDLLSYFIDLLDIDRTENGGILPLYFDIYKSQEVALEHCNNHSDDSDSVRCYADAGKVDAQMVCLAVFRGEMNGYKNFGDFDFASYNVSKEEIFEKYDLGNDNDWYYTDYYKCIDELSVEIAEEKSKKDTTEIYNETEEKQNDVVNSMNEIVKDHTVIVNQHGVDIKNPANSCDFLDKNGTLYRYIMFVINLIRIGGPILVILLTGFDSIKMFASFKDDESKKFWNHLKVRIICVALLILVPTVINFLIDVFRVSTCKYI